MSQTILRGGCLCGAIRYEADGDSAKIVNCHCSMCRRHSGAAFLTYAAYSTTQVRFAGGTVQQYRSSPGATRGHCGICGSPLTFVADAEPGTLWLTVGSFDDPNRAQPTEDWYLENKVHWVPQLASSRELPL
jgi:hypothetical protein